MRHPYNIGGVSPGGGSSLDFSIGANPGEPESATWLPAGDYRAGGAGLPGRPMGNYLPTIENIPIDGFVFLVAKADMSSITGNKEQSVYIPCYFSSTGGP